MNPSPHGSAESPQPSPNGGSHGVRVKAIRLRSWMESLGLTNAGLAREAKVSRATVSNALSGRPIQRSTFRAIAAALADLQPIPGADQLIDHDSSDGEVER